MKNRVSISLTFSADLDMVSGWGHQPEDWVDLIKSDLCRNSHYGTEVEIHSVQVGKYTYDESAGWVRPSPQSQHQGN